MGYFALLYYDVFVSSTFESCKFIMSVSKFLNKHVFRTCLPLFCIENTDFLFLADREGHTVLVAHTHLHTLHDTHVVQRGNDASF